MYINDSMMQTTTHTCQNTHVKMCLQTLCLDTCLHPCLHQDYCAILSTFLHTCLHMSRHVYMAHGSSQRSAYKLNPMSTLIVSKMSIVPADVHICLHISSRYQCVYVRPSTPKSEKLVRISVHMRTYNNTCMYKCVRAHVRLYLISTHCQHEIL